jgi:hypothetical protein
VPDATASGGSLMASRPAVALELIYSRATAGTVATQSRNRKAQASSGDAQGQGLARCPKSRRQRIDFRRVTQIGDSIVEHEHSAY